jgi:hypothetical protein
MYFLTVNKGWVRTVLVSQPIGNTSILRGLILSQFNVAGANFAPVCSPIAYIKEQSHTNPTNVAYGETRGQRRPFANAFMSSKVRAALPAVLRAHKTRAGVQFDTVLIGDAWAALI